MKNIFNILILSIILVSCDPCDRCGEPLNFDPTVELIFINVDTLVKIDQELLVVGGTLSAQRASEDLAEDAMDSLEARLVEVIDLIEGGDPSYEEERDVLEDLILTYLDSLNNYYPLIIDETDSVQRYFTSHRRDIAEGLLKIDTLYIGRQYLVYLDSAKSYHLPLLMNEESFTRYEIIIGDNSGEIAFDYDLVESVDVRRDIRLRALNIQPVSHTFDSISDPQCVTSECRDHETTVYIYF